MSSTNDPQSQEAPHFFGSNSEFENKAELAEKGTRFCIMDVSDTETVYGMKWFLQVFEDGAEELTTITFAHGDPEKSKREKDFLALSQHPEYLPVHACTLKKYNFEGRQGYRIVARSGGGPCPCTTDVEVSDNPFLPDYPDESGKDSTPPTSPQEQPASTIIMHPAPPDSTVTIMGPPPKQAKKRTFTPISASAGDVTTTSVLDNQPASPAQYKEIGKFSALLDRDVDTPETYGEASALIAKLEQDYQHMTAQLHQPVKTESGIPMR